MPPVAELIAVGTELLLGSIANTDGQEISRALAAIGIHVYWHTVVGDNPERLAAAVALAKSRASVIVTTGGLGPTCDDLTKNVLARAFGMKLVRHEPSVKRIERYFQASHPGQTMTENNYLQAMLPEGCDVLDNDWGTAPGCAWTKEGVTVVMLPGPPRECTAMLLERAIPYLKRLSEGEIFSRTLCLFGISESAMEERLREQMLTMTNPTLAPYAKEGTLELRITAKGAARKECLELIEPVEQQLRREFGALIYGVDETGLAPVACRMLLRSGKTLATAESCTGGLLSGRVTDQPGISAAFAGGVVCYTDESKQRLLGIPSALLEEYGAVSPRVCRAMAEQVRLRLNADLGLSVTGVAGPDSDERGNPVGLIYVALSDGATTWVRTLHLSTLRDRNRHVTCHHGFDLLRRYLSHLPMNGEEFQKEYP